MQSKIVDNQGLEIPLSGFYLTLLPYYRNKADNTKGWVATFKQSSQTKITSSQMRNQQRSESFNPESFSPKQSSRVDHTERTLNVKCPRTRVFPTSSVAS